MQTVQLNLPPKALHELSRYPRSLVDEAIIEFKDDAARICVVDPAHVAMLVLAAKLPFTGHGRFTIDLDQLACFEGLPDEQPNPAIPPQWCGSMEFHDPEDGTGTRLTASARQTTVKLKCITDPNGKVPTVPNILFTCGFTVRSNDLLQALKLAERTSDHIILSAKSDGSIVLETDGDNKVHVTLAPQGTVPQEKRRTRALYSVDYLSNMAGRFQPDATLAVDFAGDAPIRLRGQHLLHIPGEFTAEVTFIMAPRIDHTKA